MSADTLRQVQRRSMLGLLAVIGLFFVSGFGELYSDVHHARRGGELTRICQADWNDNLLNGVREGTEQEWQRVLQRRPELLVRVCSTDAAVAP